MQSAAPKTEFFNGPLSLAESACLGDNGRTMSELVFLNGRWIAAAEAGLPLTDGGFVQGTTIAEQLRTFGGRLFDFDEHIDRMDSSLAVLGLEPPMARSELRAAAERLVAHNHALLNEGDDLGLSVFATPGDYPAYSRSTTSQPLLAMHTYPLPFRLWAEKYSRGQHLAVSSVRQVPSACWPAHVKCRSRMHYYLADREVARRYPGARAVLLDLDGFITEASTANVLIYRRDEGLISPPLAHVLPGVTLGRVFRLAEGIGLNAGYRNLTTDDIAAADEVMLSSTPFCLLPVTRFDGRPVGDGAPGPVFSQLLAELNRFVGLDIAAQAMRFAGR